MDEMIGYIFQSLKTTENTIKNFNKSLKHQNGFNRKIMLFSLATTAYICVSEVQRKKEKEELETKLEIQDKAIDMLNQKLKSLKGEAKM